MSQNMLNVNKREKRSTCLEKKIMEHNVGTNLHYLYSINAVTLVTQHNVILANLLEKFSEELHMIYHEILVMLLGTLDE